MPTNGLEPDDFSASTATTGVAAVGANAAGHIESSGDHDWFRVDLTGGVLAAPATSVRPEPPASPPAAVHGSGVATDAPLCMQCGIQMTRAGSCYVCGECGTTSGCS